MGLFRRSPLLGSGRWTRQRPTTEHGREMWQAEQERDRARAAEEKALVEGCEYKTEFLVGLFKALGCQLCGKWHPPAHGHHVVTRRRGARAEHQVMLGARCHDRGHRQGWSDLERLYGRQLGEVAAQNAAAGLAAGYLPVERCDLCSIWHSTRYLLDLIQPEKPIQRICVWCAPPGPI